MSTQTATHTAALPADLSTDVPAAGQQPVWKHGLAAAPLASGTTTVLATIASSAGVSFADRTGTSIPIVAFAQLTFVFSLLSVGIASAMARKARRPRLTFLRAAVTLTALSVVPDLTFGFDAGSASTLVGLHAVAAAIVVPTLARRLARTH